MQYHFAPTSSSRRGRIRRDTGCAVAVFFSKSMVAAAAAALSRRRLYRSVQLLPLRDNWLQRRGTAAGKTTSWSAQWPPPPSPQPPQRWLRWPRARRRCASCSFQPRAGGGGNGPRPMTCLRLHVRRPAAAAAAAVADCGECGRGPAGSGRFVIPCRCRRWLLCWLFEAAPDRRRTGASVVEVARLSGSAPVTLRVERRRTEGGATIRWWALAGVRRRRWRRRCRPAAVQV